jgi:hypothetical protein
MGLADEHRGRTGEEPLLQELLDQQDLAAPILVTLRCECGDRRCTTSMLIALDEYAEIRADSTLFIVARDHLPDLYELVHEHPQFTVVRSGDRAPAAFGETPLPLQLVPRAGRDRFGAAHPPSGADRAPGGAGAVELQSRLIAIRDVLEREGQALARHHDENMVEVLVEIEELKLSIATALVRLRSPLL